MQGAPTSTPSLQALPLSLVPTRRRTPSRADIADKCAQLLLKYFAGEEEAEGLPADEDDGVGGGSDDGQIGEADHAQLPPGAQHAGGAPAGFAPQQQQHFGFGIGHPPAAPAGGWSFGMAAGAPPPPQQQQQQQPGGFNFSFQ